MQNRWNNFKWKMARWADGRYGHDRLNKHLVWFSVAMWIAAIFFPDTSLWRLLPLALGWAALIASTFRMLSRNVYARQKELRGYERITAKPRQFFKLQKNKWQDRKTHRYFRCKCGAALRVPRGRGKIVITCPKCKKQLHKKT